MKVLVVEDDPHIVKILTIYCTAEGHSVVALHDGRGVVAQVRADAPDIILLDLNLPELDGVEVCRRVRAISSVPIMMITARDEEVDRLLGLEVGADDYVTKPFSPREVVARMRAIHRRVERPQPLTPTDSPTSSVPMLGVITLTQLLIDLDSRVVWFDKARVDGLTNKEFELLVTLARHPGRVYSRGELETALYGGESLVTERAISVHIANLRAKLPNPRIIETIYGIGYKLVRT